MWHNLMVQIAVVVLGLVLAGIAGKAWLSRASDDFWKDAWDERWLANRDPKCLPEYYAAWFPTPRYDKAMQEFGDMKSGPHRDPRRVDRMTEAHCNAYRALEEDALAERLRTGEKDLCSPLEPTRQTSQLSRANRASDSSGDGFLWGAVAGYTYSELSDTSCDS